MGVLLDRIGVGLPVVQAGMGGGLAGHQLAATVSAAGGLGTIGFLAPEALPREIAATRVLTERPLAVNLLLPFARRAHFEVASEADVVVTFWGRPKRMTSKVWIHQCGSVSEALAAQRAGADAVIAQGVEAEAAVCGTRFLMTEESGAHPAYKARLLEAQETILTELFGAGWPAPHRVVRNQATARWLTHDPRGPGWLRAMHRASAPVMSRAPMAIQFRLAATQRASRPLFGPAAAIADGPPNPVEAGPLYAGECVDRIGDIRPAGQLVAELAGGS